MDRKKLAALLSVIALTATLGLATSGSHRATVDPNGVTTSGNHRAAVDPNGVTTSGNHRAAVDPNGHR